MKIKNMVLGFSLFLGAFFLTTIPVFAADYVGSGQFPAGQSVRWKFTGFSGGYESHANISMGRWHTYTDVSMLKVTSNEDIKVTVGNWGITAWYGIAYICDIYGNCDNTTAWSNTFASCDLDYNAYFTATSAEKENTFMHEAGHCLSLGHRDNVGSIMDPDRSSQTWLNATDKTLINNRY